MRARFADYRTLAWIFWLFAAIAIAIWSQVPGYVVGWDLRVYEAAMHSLQAGHDPYLDGMAIQHAYHAQTVHAVNDPPPFTYVYSPLTLPLVRLASFVPPVLSGSLYWALYVAMVLAAIWVCLQIVERDEAKLFALIAPAVVFFPGLLENDVIFSGNIAYIFHGAALLAAYRGWKKADWRWFYVVVLLASCFKAPLLYLLAIPVLSARAQWVPALSTGAAGAVLFALQPMIWPATFRHYLEAVELQFSYNHDFSSSPAGLLADALYNVIPYKVTSGVFYVFYASIFFAVLFYVSRRRFLPGRISWKQWAPVLILGVLMLNPRIMEYDIGPATLAMLLVFWRFLRRGTTTARAAFVGLWVFGALNVAAPRGWRTTECIVMVCLLAAGVWDLLTSGEASVAAGAETSGDLLEIGA